VGSLAESLRSRQVFVSRPLLVIDGDSFAHRAYHGVPKSIRRRGNRGGGAIVGFANFLLRLYESERPRAVHIAQDMEGIHVWIALQAKQGV
jgi:DNA polymerase-1